MGNSETCAICNMYKVRIQTSAGNHLRVQGVTADCGGSGYGGGRPSPSQQKGGYVAGGKIQASQTSKGDQPTTVRQIRAPSSIRGGYPSDNTGHVPIRLTMLARPSPVRAPRQPRQAASAIAYQRPKQRAKIDSMTIVRSTLTIHEARDTPRAGAHARQRVSACGIRRCSHLRRPVPHVPAVAVAQAGEQDAKL